MLAIRLGTLDDLVPLADIEISAASLFPRGKIPHPHESLPYEVMREAVKNQLLFCAELQVNSGGKTLVAFAACHLYEHYLHLDEISVLPDYGKQGIGSLLVKHLIKESAQRKCQGITLSTFSDIPWNAPFYKKLGFTELAYSETPKHVQAMLDEEKSIGLKNRVAMFKKN
jgi:ribosomal protein S18 acetylase RimI-like enzyme